MTCNFDSRPPVFIKMMNESFVLILELYKNHSDLCLNVEVKLTGKIKPRAPDLFLQEISLTFAWFQRK